MMKELVPLELLMKALLKCYKATLSLGNDVVQSIQKAEDLMLQVQQEKALSQTTRAIEHVFYATKCYFLYEMEKLDELAEILDNIINTDNFTATETGALYGCQSVMWSCLNDFGMDKAVDNAKKAIETNQDCALWHYVLAKNLRRQRYIIEFSSKVTDLEEKHFEVTCTISNTPMFRIYYLQMCIEKYYKFHRSKTKRMPPFNEYNKVTSYLETKAAVQKTVLQLAKNILELKPSSYKVLLKLAFMFLQASDSDETLLVKECLDVIEEMAPSNSTFLHYTGMLYEECGEFRDALMYYKKAADYNNFVAELAYIRYGWETGELQPLPHLLRMLKKYEQSVKERQISMFLAIAVTYYSLHKDKENAAEYFLKALTIDPQSKMFEVYYTFFDFNTLSIYNFLNNIFVYKIDSFQMNNSKLKETNAKIKKLLDTRNVSDLIEKFGFSTDSREHCENPNN